MEPATHECGILVNERAAARLAKTEMARKWLSWEPAGRVGLNAGLALAGLNIVNWLVGVAAGGAFANTLGQATGFINPSTERLAFFAGCVLFLARLALFFLVGLRVTRRTGVVSRGDRCGRGGRREWNGGDAAGYRVLPGLYADGGFHGSGSAGGERGSRNRSAGRRAGRRGGAACWDWRRVTRK